MHQYVVRAAANRLDLLQRYVECRYSAGVLYDEPAHAALVVGVQINADSRRERRSLRRCSRLVSDFRETVLPKVIGYQAVEREYTMRQPQRYHLY